MPAAIFGFAVGLFPFIGLAVPSLCLAVIFSFSGCPTCIAAVSLPPEASPADTENQSAPSAPNLDQQQDAHTSVIAISRRMQ
jgi:hypothetical protein